MCAARIILRHYKSQKILGTGGVGTDGAWISGLFLQTWTVGLSRRIWFSVLRRRIDRVFL